MKVGDKKKEEGSWGGDLLALEFFTDPDLQLIADSDATDPSVRDVLNDLPTYIKTNETLNGVILQRLEQPGVDIKQFLQTYQELSPAAAAVEESKWYARFALGDCSKKTTDSDLATAYKEVEAASTKAEVFRAMIQVIQWGDSQSRFGFFHSKSSKSQKRRINRFHRFRMFCTTAGCRLINLDTLARTLEISRNSERYGVLKELGKKLSSEQGIVQIPCHPSAFEEDRRSYLNMVLQKHREVGNDAVATGKIFCELLVQDDDILPEVMQKWAGRDVAELGGFLGKQQQSGGGDRCDSRLSAAKTLPERQGRFEGCDDSLVARRTGLI